MLEETKLFSQELVAGGDSPGDGEPLPGKGGSLTPSADTERVPAAPGETFNKHSHGYLW